MIRKFSIRVFAAAAAVSVAAYVGCSDLERVSSSSLIEGPLITSIIPSTGPVGARVLIGGTGFGPDSIGKQVYFNDTIAPVETSTDTSILTRVPEEALTGPVRVVIRGDTLTGPEFTVAEEGEITLAIDRIEPEEGRYGDPVTIIGSGFSAEPAGNSVYFNGSFAEVGTVTDTSLTTTVPQGAETGPVMVIADRDTAIGPSFTVLVPEISSISPTSGPTGTEVTINGNNFSATVSENTITFNGTEAPVNSAEEDLLVTQVPDSATDGPVEVTVSGATATGPDFDVITGGTLRAVVATSGSDLDSNGYILTTDSGDTLQTEVNDTLFVSDLEEGSHQVELSGIASNCMLPETSSNPRSVSIAAGDTTSTTFDLNCQQLTGTLEVFISTSGSDLDSDGYTLTVDGSNSQSADINDTLYVFDLSEGSHQVELFGIASNCQATSSNPRSVSITGGNTTSTTFDVNCQSVQQGQIYYASNQGSVEIYRMDPDGSNQTAITSNSQYDAYPVPSNDGSKIAFVNNNSGSMDLYVMNADGTNVQQLASSTADIWLGGWSPDDSKIAFYYSDPASSTNTDIYTINADGSGQVQLTNDPANDNYPAWSPDGSKIAFSSLRDGDYEIYTMNPDGSGIQQITNNSTYEQRPRWSPDGSKIAFDRNDIYIIDADGSNEIQITDYNADPLDGISWCQWPSWSPDGSELVFYCDDYEVRKANADGSGTPVNLTNKPDITDFAPFWGTGQ